MTYPADRSGIQRADGGSPVILPSSTDLAGKPAVPLTEMRIAIVISDPGVTSAIIGRGMMKLLALSWPRT